MVTYIIERTQTLKDTFYVEADSEDAALSILDEGEHDAERTSTVDETAPTVVDIRD